MSWNGTVTCGYCYDQGHNRRSCPQLKKNLARRLAEDPDDSYAKYELAKQNKGKVRRCTYCNLKGHNRRTCEELNTAKQDWREQAAAWRLKFINWCVESGVGPGALVSKKGGWHHDDDKVFIVKRPEWNTLNHDAQQKTSYPAYALQLIDVGMVGSIEYVSLPKIEGLAGDDNSTYHASSGMEVKGPIKITEEAFVKIAPQWWLDGKGSSNKQDLKVRFEDRKSPNHYDNQFED